MQTLSVVLVVIIVCLGAIGLGYLSAPPVRNLVLFTAALIAPSVVFDELVNRRTDGKHTPIHVVLLLIAIAVLAFVYAVIQLASVPSGDPFGLNDLLPR